MRGRRMTTTIDSKNLYYRNLNRRIRVAFLKGQKEIVLKNVLGQRYIGGGLNVPGRIVIHGTPGQDLGAFMNGPEIRVLGNAQDGVANTMNAGKIVVVGKAGEIPGYSMRGGKVLIGGDVEYRAGIHMKEYKDQIPILVIGGTAKDYCGEYMAGGRIVVLNLKNGRSSPVGDFVGTGIHGGSIFIRGTVDSRQLGIGAVFNDIDGEDIRFLEEILQEFAREMWLDLSGIDPAKDFVKITRRGYRPFGNLYTPAVNVKTGLPRHVNLSPPAPSPVPREFRPPPSSTSSGTGGSGRPSSSWTSTRLSECPSAGPSVPRCAWRPATAASSTIRWKSRNWPGSTIPILRRSGRGNKGRKRSPSSAPAPRACPRPGSFPGGDMRYGFMTGSRSSEGRSGEPFPGSGYPMKPWTGILHGSGPFPSTSSSAGGWTGRTSPGSGRKATLCSSPRGPT